MNIEFELKFLNITGLCFAFWLKFSHERTLQNNIHSQNKKNYIQVQYLCLRHLRNSPILSIISYFTHSLTHAVILSQNKHKHSSHNCALFPARLLIVLPAVNHATIFRWSINPAIRAQTFQTPKKYHRLWPIKP